MIFDELILHNFGVYKGRQSVLLTPPSKEKPVILFGGLNGGGKTTLLQAIHLVLYGKRARSYNSKKTNYEEYLQGCIHKGTPLQDGASLELEFRHRNDGEERTYKIRRSWRVPKNRINEYLEVLVNGKVDKVLSNTWDEQVEEFIPVGIANLFLFDGEKIESFADPEGSKELLSSAIFSLLGLELVDRLGSDIKTLERRKRAELKGKEELNRLKSLEHRLQELQETRTLMIQQLAGQRNEVEQAQKELKRANSKFKNEGGELYQQKHALEQESADFHAQLEEDKTELWKLAGLSEAPLLLLLDLMGSLELQANRESLSKGAESVSHILEERDFEVLEKIKAAGLTVKWVETLDKLLEEDRSTREQAATQLRYLGLSDLSFQKLRQLLVDKGPRIQIQAEQQSNKYAETLSEIERIERTISKIPEQETIEELVTRREEFKEQVDLALAKFSQLEQSIQMHEKEIQEVQKELDSFVEEWTKQEDLQNMLQHAQFVQDALGLFRERVVLHHIGQIESLILDSFQQLLRKKSLISSLSIEPKEFSLRLEGPKGELPPERLSVGERQLLAVSMLWGLARASGRPIPTVIDTPLGRLDSTHRKHLIERYFPHASHQTLLLSTDEEIDEEYHEQLKKWIGREYTLRFDDETGTTTIEPGYFV